MKFKDLIPSDGMDILIAEKRLTYSGAWYCDGMKLSAEVIAFLQDNEFKALPKKGEVVTAGMAAAVVKPGDTIFVAAEVLSSDQSSAPIRVYMDGETSWLSKDATVIIV